MARLSETGSVPILNPLTPTSGRRRDESAREIPPRRKPKPDEEGAGDGDAPGPGDDPAPKRGLIVDEYA